MRAALGRSGTDNDSIKKQGLTGDKSEEGWCCPRSYMHRLRFGVILGARCTLKIQSRADGTRAAFVAHAWAHKIVFAIHALPNLKPELRSVRSGGVLVKMIKCREMHLANCMTDSERRTLPG